MIYRTVEQTEYDSLAKLHLRAFNDFFLSTLGYNFLKTYYQAALKSKESLAVCAVDEKGDLVGFSIGCIHSKGFHKRLLLQNTIKFALQAIRIIFTNLKAIFRLINNLDKNANKDDDGNYAELLSIAVSPDSKNLGIGKELIKEFEFEAIKKGCKKIALTTDYSNNDQVISFYKKAGYSVFYEFTTNPNRKMYKLIKLLNQ